MTTLEKAEKLLTELTRSEKAQLLRWVIDDLGESAPGIESTPGVAGGAACIIRTRIPVWVLSEAREQALTDAEILAAYPTLRALDLANAWSYARSNSEEIERQRRMNREA